MMKTTVYRGLFLYPKSFLWRTTFLLHFGILWLVNERQMEKKKNYRILIADDNQTARKGLRALLSSFRLKQEQDVKIEIVGEAENGQEAVTLAKDLIPDLIFMDINMPIMDGLMATRVIKDKLMNTKIIVLSMHNDQRDAAIHSGADDFIEKGTDPKKLKQIVSNIIKEICHES